MGVRNFYNKARSFYISLLNETTRSKEAKLADTLEFLQYGKTSKWEAQCFIDVYLPRKHVVHMAKDDVLTIPYSAVKYLPKDKLIRLG